MELQLLGDDAVAVVLDLALRGALLGDRELRRRVESYRVGEVEISEYGRV